MCAEAAEARPADLGRPVPVSAETNGRCSGESRKKITKDRVTDKKRKMLSIRVENDGERPATAMQWERSFTVHTENAQRGLQAESGGQAAGAGTVHNKRAIRQIPTAIRSPKSR